MNREEPTFDPGSRGAGGKPEDRSSGRDPSARAGSGAPEGGGWRALAFIARMAWRDSRASRRRLLVFTLCITAGIAALVAVGSFGRSLEQSIAEQARALLGADLAIGSRVRFTPEHEEFFAALPGEKSREISFTTMVSFPERNGVRLAQLRALEGGFPFYGKIETSPTNAAHEFRSQGGALVEESLLVQFGVSIGDHVRIGNLTTRVIGALQRVPGESVVFATLAPRVYIRMSDLDATGLLQTGSLARYRVLVRLPDQTDVPMLLAGARPRMNDLRLNVTTVDERKEDLGNSLANLTHYLNLAGFAALFLGGIGIASAIQAHVRQKIPTIAILRCLGCPMKSAFAIYLLQAVCLGAVGVVAGTIAGLAIQRALPRVAADFVPFEATMRTSWGAVGEAATLGFVMCLLFALFPLAGIRRVAPLGVLRAAYEAPRRRMDPLRWAIGIALTGVVVAFAMGHSESWRHGLGIAGGLGAAFLALALVARLVVAAARRARLNALPFVVRQGLANVHRPNNRTFLLVLSLGLGTFLLLTLQLSQSVLLTEMFSSRESGRANAILFDIQPDQRDAVAEVLREQGLPVLDHAPIVAMRLKSIAGRSVEEILADQDSKTPRWALRREFRSTFTGRLRDSEKIIAGEWIGRVEEDASPIPVSVEADIAKELGVGLGDILEWDVQGIPLPTRVASLREVDWRRVQPNFFVLFPRGPLDEAPAFHVMVTRVDSAEQSARLQRSIVEQFPNVSVVDITLVLRTLDQVLGKIAFVLRFMALFTVATGLLVLVAAVWSGQFQRVRESTLLRVLGASRKQVMRVLMVEYATLGILAAATGIALAFAAAGGLAFFMFEVAFVPPIWPPLLAAGVVVTLTMATGFVASRGITNHPPLETLRSEG